MPHKGKRGVGAEENYGAGITIIGQYKAIIRDVEDCSILLLEIVVVIFEVFRTKSKVLGRIGRSGKVLGFISSNFGPNPTAGRPPKGNNQGAIIIKIIPDGKSTP